VCLLDCVFVNGNNLKIFFCLLKNRFGQKM
jgi:hypothetical protein